MKCARQIDGTKGPKMSGKVLHAIFVAAICVCCFCLIRKWGIQMEEEQVKVLSEEEQLIEFEEYFRKCKDDLQRYIELSMESVLKEEEYIVVFNEKWYRSCLQQYEEWGWNTILYIDEKFVAEEHKEVEEILNKDTDLKEALELIRDNGAIIAVNQRYLDESMQMTEFMLDIDYAPLLTVDHYDHDQSASLFWSDDKGFEEYGYKNFEGDWYRFVGLNEEQQAKAREAYWEEVSKEYIELEKLFRENEDCLNDFIEASRDTILEEKAYYMLFDSQSYSSTQSDEERITILYDVNFSSKEEEDEVKALDENDDLREALNSIKEKKVITYIGSNYLNKNAKEIYFSIDTKFTPFVTSNSGSTNYFIWCDNKECEKYGYKNVGGNWYMHIVEPPE